MLLAAALMIRLHVRDIRSARAAGHQLLANAHRARCVLHIDHGALVLRVDLDRRVSGRGRGAADQQRLRIAQPLHFLGHMHHLVERGRDQPRQADEIRAFTGRCFQDLLAGRHDPQVHHLEVITLQDHADDVLADVVNIAFDRGDHHLAVGAAGAVLLLLDVGNEH